MTIYNENQSLLQLVENVFNIKYAGSRSNIKLFGYNFLTEVMIATSTAPPSILSSSGGGRGWQVGHTWCRWGVIWSSKLKTTKASIHNINFCGSIMNRMECDGSSQLGRKPNWQIALQDKQYFVKTNYLRKPHYEENALKDDEKLKVAKETRQRLKSSERRPEVNGLYV